MTMHSRRLLLSMGLALVAALAAVLLAAQWSARPALDMKKIEMDAD